jgi:methanethiol S-methyltransferase
MLKRTLFLTYGAVSYLVFFGTYLYAIGFIGGFAVPSRLDGPARGPLGVALAIDAGLLGLFAVQHSVMARPWFKDAWTRVVPRPVERSTYVLFSSLALILLFRLWQPMGGEVWSVSNPAGRVALYGLFGFGFGLVLVCTFLINHFDLFGLRQVWLAFRGRDYTPVPFATPAPYRVVRHPLYVGWFFAFWMTPTMTLAHLVFAIATTTYILVAIRFEEHDLLAEHGELYADYRRRVPMLMPFGRGRGPAPARRASAVAVRS